MSGVDDTTGVTAGSVEHLRQLAQAAATYAQVDPIPRMRERPMTGAWRAYSDALEPEAVLALLDRLVRAEAAQDALAMALAHLANWRDIDIRTQGEEALEQSAAAVRLRGEPRP